MLFIRTHTYIWYCIWACVINIYTLKLIYLNIYAQICNPKQKQTNKQTKNPKTKEVNSHFILSFLEIESFTASDFHWWFVLIGHHLTEMRLFENLLKTIKNLNKTENFAFNVKFLFNGRKCTICFHGTFT